MEPQEIEYREEGAHILDLEGFEGMQRGSTEASG